MNMLKSGRTTPEATTFDVGISIAETQERLLESNSTDMKQGERMVIGENIKNRLKEKGMSQIELAIASGSTAAAVSRYVNGSREPSSRTLAKLAKALGCTADDLLKGVQ